MTVVSTSEKIRSRLIDNEVCFTANDCITDFILEGELPELQKEVQEKVQALLEALVIDTTNDPNTEETSKRVAKMFINEVMKGRFHKPPELRTFPNTKKLDEMMVVGPITVRSMCSHHLVPIIGQCWIGVIPGNKLLGLSKFARICDWIMSRPQIQEEATIQLADYIEEVLNPAGLAIVIKATHMCMQWRGIKDQATMTTSVLRGVLAKNSAAKQEFLEFIKT